LAEPNTREGAAARLSNLGYLVVPAPGQTDDPSLAPWAAKNSDKVDIAAMAYHYSKNLDQPVSNNEIFKALGDEHDKG
jgi:hypothetical protein